MEKILDVVDRECPDSQVILLGLLPRGIPNDAGAIRWPSKYARGLLAVNARYEAAAAKCALKRLQPDQLNVLKWSVPSVAHPSSFLFFSHVRHRYCSLAWTWNWTWKRVTSTPYRLDLNFVAARAGTRRCSTSTAGPPS